MEAAGGPGSLLSVGHQVAGALQWVLRRTWLLGLLVPLQLLGLLGHWRTSRHARLGWRQQQRQQGQVQHGDRLPCRRRHFDLQSHRPMCWTLERTAAQGGGEFV